MREHMARIRMAGDQLSDVCNELDRLARRIETVRDEVLTAAAAAGAATTETPSNGSPTIRKVLPPVRGLRTSPEVIVKVKAALRLGTKKEAEIVAGGVVGALEETLADNIDKNGFSFKLGSFGKFSIRHRPGGYRKISLTGETKMASTRRKVKFVAIGRLRQLEKVDGAH